MPNTEDNDDLPDPDDIDLAKAARKGDVYARLMLAIESDDAAGVRQAVEAGADLQHQAYFWGWLEDADRCDCMKSLKELLRLAAPVPEDFDCCDACSSVRHAIRKGDEELVLLLRKAGAQFDYDALQGARPKDVFEATEWGRLGDVQSFLKTNPSLIKECGGESGLTPLHIAAKHNEVEIVRFLLERGADPNAKDRGHHEDLTPLHLAAEYGACDAARLLLGAGAQLEARLKRDWEFHSENTPLLMAIFFGHENVARLLVESGADVRVCNGRFGETALHWTAKSDSWLEVGRLLVGKGAEVDATDGFGRTPLWNAVSERAARSVAFLVSRGANPEQKDTDGQTPRDVAKERKDRRIIRVLSEGEPPPRRRRRAGRR